MASVKVTLIGHASFRFTSEKGTTIYFDPWFNGNPTTRMKVGQVKKADLVIATHGHYDHVGDSFELCKRTRAKFVGNYEMCLVADAHGLKLGSRAIAMNPGGTLKFKDVTLTMTPVFHSMSMSPFLSKGEAPENGYFHPDGGACGFVLAFDNGITIYDSSDTCLFSDMQLIGQMHGPQIAIMPVGGLYTMGVREAARAASYIRPDVAIPCHYGKAVGQPADINELKRETKFLTANTEVVPLRPGQTLTYNAASYKTTR